MTWIVKNNNGNYFVSLANVAQGSYKTLWHDKQSKATRFTRKEEAKEMAIIAITAKVVKLKSCKESDSQLIEPKQGTVFLDLTMPSPESNIVTCVYLDRYESGGEDIEYVCTTNAISPKEDTWGTLEEYNQYLADGKIKIIWEPKP